jgi:hypothetical protein
MLRIGDRVQYWYRMGRIGTVMDVQKEKHQAMLEGGTLAGRVLVLVKFDDDKEELYPISELRLCDG